ncbi:MAG TPA: hypothetical protein VGN76_10315 [Gemmatimonadales bacterium]|nr:hypothetical protein [Gemmatimonadales bacterium]
MTSDISRRSFAETLAAAALAPLIGSTPESIRLPHGTGGAQAVPEDPGGLARSLTEVIRAQYGSRLSSQDLTGIARQIQAGLERVDQLKKAELANGDEPDFLFVAPRRPSRTP